MSTDKIISTSFGTFLVYVPPKPESLKHDPFTGYFYDVATKFYYDKNTNYYFNCSTEEWMFWSSTYRTYIPCKGGDEKLKKEFQLREIIEREEQKTEVKKEVEEDVVILDFEDEEESEKTTTSDVLIQNEMPKESECVNMTIKQEECEKENVKTISKQENMHAQTEPEKFHCQNQAVKIFVHRLPLYVNRAKLYDIAKTQGFEPTSVEIDRIITTDGQVRTEGIVTFENRTVAIRWISENWGVLKFHDGHVSTLAFYEERKTNVLMRVNLPDEKTDQKLESEIVQEPIIKRLKRSPQLTYETPQKRSKHVQQSESSVDLPSMTFDRSESSVSGPSQELVDLTKPGMSSSASENSVFEEARNLAEILDPSEIPLPDDPYPNEDLDPKALYEQSISCKNMPLTFGEVSQLPLLYSDILKRASCRAMNPYQKAFIYALSLHTFPTMPRSEMEFMLSLPKEIMKAYGHIFDKKVWIVIKYEMMRYPHPIVQRYTYGFVNEPIMTSPKIEKAFMQKENLDEMLKEEEKIRFLSDQFHGILKHACEKALNPATKTILEVLCDLDLKLPKSEQEFLQALPEYFMDKYGKVLGVFKIWPTN